MSEKQHLCCIILCTFLHFGTSSSRRHGSPNVLVLLADDVGIGDIGCYGNSTISTPNIDKISQRGVKFNHNLAAAALCTPSRAAFLTGRYPVRFGYVSHGEEERRVTVAASASGGLPSKEITFAEVLKENGYINGYFGKWHLGLHCDEKDFCHHPFANGFDYFYGLPLTHLMDCGPWSFLQLQSEVVKIPDLNQFYMSVAIWCSTCLFLNFFRKPIVLFTVLIFLCWHFQNIFLFFLYRQGNCILMRGYDIVKQPYDPSILTEYTVKEAQQFIRANHERPFFAYVAFHHAHAAAVPGYRFSGRSQHGSYGDVIEELDWGVGEIMTVLENLELLNDTLVYFSSDHGPVRGLFDAFTGEDAGGWSSIYRGSKGNNYEGGIRVPTLIQWLGVITPDVEVDKPTSHLDFFPTLFSLFDTTINTKLLDGIDISKLITSSGESVEERALFHYCGSNLHAMTLESLQQVWKVHFYLPKYENGIQTCFSDDVILPKSPVIYNLRTNPSEDKALYTTTEDYKRLLTTAHKLANEHRDGLEKDIPSQLTQEKNSFSFKRSGCCNYPFCYC